MQSQREEKDSIAKNRAATTCIKYKKARRGWNVCAMLAVDLLIVFVAFKAQKLRQKANHVSRFLSWNLSTSQGSFESAFFYLCERSEWVNVCGGFCGWGKMQKRQFLLINLSKNAFVASFSLLLLSFFFFQLVFISFSLSRFILMACKGYCSRKEIPIDLWSHKFSIKCQFFYSLSRVWGSKLILLLRFYLRFKEFFDTLR